MRDARVNGGEVDEVGETPGWERSRAQDESGAVDTAGSREIARAFEMNETIVSRRDVGFAAANESGIKNYWEKIIVGYTAGGEGVSWRIQLTDAKKVLGSVHEITWRQRICSGRREGDYDEEGDEQEEEDQI